MLTDHYLELLRKRFAGRKVVLAHGPLAIMDEMLDLMEKLGTQQPLILAETRGTGDIPDASRAPAFIVGKPADEIMAAVRSFDAGLAQLPADAAEALEQWDPRGEALVIRSLFSTLQQVAGRRMYGARQPRWIALEDKTTVDGFWRRAGINYAPGEVVEASAAAMSAAAQRVDRGEGTVWAADNKEGWHGGGVYTRLVRDEAMRRLATDYLVPRADRVRVMPFLEGIPCSIHGTVFPHQVTSYVPMEMVVLRQPERGTFFYGGASNCWAPSDTDTKAMRDVARRAGEQLRSEVDFRGSFTVDGVMTAEGFLPTELNPRYGAALAILTRSVEGLPFYLLDLALNEGEPWDFCPDELERAIRERGVATRTPRAGILARMPAGLDPSQLEDEFGLVEQEQSYRRAAEGEAVDANFKVGPSPLGAFLRVNLCEGRYIAGEAVGPKVAKLARFADAELGTDIGELEPARNVR